MMIQDILNLPEDEFCEEIEKLSLPDLEQLITMLNCYKNDNRSKLKSCFFQRKHLLNDMFEYSPENIERLRRMAVLIKDRTAILHEKGNQLYNQMIQLWSKGSNEPFTDFAIKLSLHVSYNSEDSVLLLEDDGSGSNYVQMADILDLFHDASTHNLIYKDRIDYNPERKYQSFQFEDEVGWRFSARYDFSKFPELQDTPVYWEFHQLLDHTYYSFQDIIRMNDIWGEVAVIWQQVAGQ